LGALLEAIVILSIVDGWVRLLIGSFEFQGSVIPAIIVVFSIVCRVRRQLMIRNPSDEGRVCYALSTLRLRAWDVNAFSVLWSSLPLLLIMKVMRSRWFLPPLKYTSGSQLKKNDTSGGRSEQLH
jgi:hypothetical protein